MSERRLERTLVLLKPDAVQRGLLGEIIARFERVGAKIVGMKMLISSKDMAEKHYTEDIARRHGEFVRTANIEMLLMGPTVAMALEGIDIVAVVRKMVGATQPSEAAPGTIRGDFAHISVRYAKENQLCIFNLVHASDSPESADAEIALWFKPDELVEHKPGYTKLTLRE